MKPRLLVWATTDTLSVTVGDKYYKQKITREQLLYLAQLFLEKAIEGRKSD